MYSNKYVIELIKDAINDEEVDFKYYSDLANSIRDIDDKKTLEQMSLDEQKHKKMFQDIYKKLTNENYTPENISHKNISHNFSENLTESIKGELRGVEAYRPILFSLENPQFKNYLIEIITDEQNHAARLNYMYSKYR